MNLTRTTRVALLAIAVIGMAASSASAVEIRQQSGVRPLRPAGPSLNSSNTSGSYFSEQGVLIKRNGDRLDDRRRSPRAKAPGSTPSVNHMQWCQNRYNSYSRNDNTYQPYAGTRRTCSSPFGG